MSKYFEVNSEAFEEWLFGMHHRFQQMVQTLIDVHYLIQANTNQLVPLDTGRLEQSYHYNLIEQNESFIELHSVYDAVDPESGFHYAEYQHELNFRGRAYNSFNAPHPYYMGSPSYYVRALQGHPVGNHHRHGTRGVWHYLSRGVRASENMAWVMIETDYLSLFNGGIL